MAQPTNQFLIDLNADIASKVTEQTELVTVVTRFLWEHPENFEDSFALQLNGTLTAAWKDAKARSLPLSLYPYQDKLPSALVIKSINGTAIHMPSREQHIPAVLRPGQSLIDATYQCIAKKPVDVEVISKCLHKLLEGGVDATDPEVQAHLVTDGVNVVTRYVGFDVVEG